LFKLGLGLDEDVLKGPIGSEIIATGQRIVDKCHHFLRVRLNQKVGFDSEWLDDDFVREWGRRMTAAS
jgi:hypothetical protein